MHQISILYCIDRLRYFYLQTKTNKIMPTFSECQDVEVELNISVGDFYDEMDEDEKALMLDYILEDQEKKGEFIKKESFGSSEEV